MKAEPDPYSNTVPHEDSLLTRLKRGLGAQAFGQAVQIFIRLAEVPLLLAFWGPRLYGEWLMLTAIPAYLAMADGGFAGAASRKMAMRSGAGDRAGALGVFQSTWALLLVVSGAVFLGAALLAQAFPLGTWLGFEAMAPASLKIILLLLVTHVLVGFQGGLLYGGFWCSGCYPAGMALSALTHLLEFMGLALMVLLGGGPVEAAAGFLAGRVLGTVLLWLGLRQATPWLEYGFGRASLGEIRRLTVPAFASLAFPLGNALNIQGTRLAVGLVLGPPAVAVFVPMRTLTRLALQPVNVVNRLMEPEMGTAFGKGDTALFGRLFTRSCQVSLWLGLSVSLALAGAGSWLLSIWTAGKVEMHWALFLLLLGAAATNAMWYTALMVPYATNRHGRIALSYSLIYGGAALMLAHVSAELLGYIGVGTALLVAELAMAGLVVSAALRLSDCSWIEWALSIVRPPVFLLRHGLAAFRSIRAQTHQGVPLR